MKPTNPHMTLIHEYLNKDIHGVMQKNWSFNSRQELTEWSQNMIKACRENDVNADIRVLYQQRYLPKHADDFYRKSRDYSDYYESNYQSYFKKVERILGKSSHREMRKSLLEFRSRIGSQKTVYIPLGNGIKWLSIKQSTFAMFYIGSVGKNHVFDVLAPTPEDGIEGYIKHIDGSMHLHKSINKVSNIGTVVCGPLGWFPCGNLCDFFEWVQSAVPDDYWENSLSYPTDENLSKWQRDAIKNTIDDLKKIKCWMAFLVLMSCNNTLNNSLPLTQYIEDLSHHYQREQRIRTMHFRQAHQAFRWVKESNVTFGEPIYGRIQRKNTLVKVRRSVKETIINKR